ncbi:MAG: alpha-isopropylmalate synthase regulatory domain-containing protein, partial [Planctomycetota bacterium]
YDADIAALIDKRAGDAADDWRLVSYELKSTTDNEPMAVVTLARGAEDTVTDTFFGGDGPLDNLFRAVEKVTGLQAELKEFSVRSVSRGKDAQGEATIEVQHAGRLCRGRAVSTDTVAASVEAYVAAVNRAAAGGGQPVESTGRKP